MHDTNTGFQRAVVLGAGTMGASIAAHLANAGVGTTLLDIVPAQLTPEEAAKGLTLADRAVRDRIVRAGLARALESRPAAFFTPELADRVRIGNLEDDLDAVAKADWVIEAVVEDLQVKRALLERVERLRPDGLATPAARATSVHAHGPSLRSSRLGSGG